MRMNPTDLADISAYIYTCLMNGAKPAGNWTGLCKRGERVRLRFICSGAQSFFGVRIPGLKMPVVHVDGQDVEPVTVDSHNTEHTHGDQAMRDANVENRGATDNPMGHHDDGHDNAH